MILSTAFSSTACFVQTKQEEREEHQQKEQEEWKAQIRWNEASHVWHCTDYAREYVQLAKRMCPIKSIFEILNWILTEFASAKVSPSLVKKVTLCIFDAALNLHVIKSAQLVI